MKTKSNKYFYIHIPFLILVSLFSSNCAKEDDLMKGLEEFELTYPTNNSSDVKTEVTLEWNYLEGSVTELPFSNTTLYLYPVYIVQLWEKNTGNIIINDTTNISFLYIENLKYSTDYQWKVITYISNDIVQESEDWEFRTEYKTYSGDVRLYTQEDVDEFGKSVYQKITGDVHINSTWNDPIVDLATLSSLVTIKGSLYISSNNDLTSINGFNNLTIVEGAFNLDYNNVLASVKGFNNLESVSSFYLINNPALVELDAFKKLSYVKKSAFNITGNDKLITLPGFESLNYVAESFTIYGNENLTIIDGFNGLDSIGGKLNIRMNDSLNSIQGFNNIKLIGGKLDLSAKSSISSFDNLITIGSDLLFTNEKYLTSISGFSNLKTVGGNFSIKYNTNLTSVNGFNILEHIGKDFDIYYNLKLETFEGFNGIVSIGGSFIVWDTNLSILNGSDKLESIGEKFKIKSNEQLTAIDGFENLSYVGSDLEVQLNSLLSEFCGLKNLIIVNGLQGEYTVSYNLINPTIEEIRVLDCN